MKLWYNDVRMKPKGVILMSEEKKQLIATINLSIYKDIKRWRE